MSRSALDIASYFLAKETFGAHDISNMKLQKLLYYAQGFHLAQFGSPLFHENIEKWPYGPVVVEVYQAYKGFGGNPISSNIPAPALKSEEIETLNRIYSIFGAITAYSLSDMTHRERPWLETEDNQVIPLSLIQAFFLQVVR